MAGSADISGRQNYVLGIGHPKTKATTEAPPAMLSTDSTGKVNGIVGADGQPVRIPFLGDDSIMAMGDSITADGNTTPTSTTDYIIGGKSYLGWACILSLGKLKFGGVAATGGFNTAQIIATHLPTIVAARPRYCVVHAGTNDYGTLSLAQTIANLTTIYSTLLANGITPIATTLLPKQTLIGSSAYIIQRVNVWIQRQARILSIPCVDWNSQLSNPADGNWIGYGTPGTYNQDSTHPNETGARLMGQAIFDSMNSYGLLQRPVYLPRVNNGSYFSTYSPSDTNALLLTDTNADGTADGLNKSGTGTLSLSAMSGAEGIGNWQNLAATGAGAVYAFGNNSAIVPGNRMLFACRIKTSGVVSSAGQFDVRFTDSNTVDIFGFRNIKQDITNGVIYQEFTVPAGMATLLARPYFSVQGTGAVLSVGQVSVIDLTALGIA